MCGINLIIDKKGKLTEDNIRRMTAATGHRGPDATGFHIAEMPTGRVYFGHNRLKIIDPSAAANQPFFSEDGRYLLVYNGELYNYRELRQGLQQSGCRFRTQSDTEVILQLFIHEGQRALSKLNGMFSLAFYDTRLQLLWLARDRFGLKPLFYADSEDYLVISSEIKGIHASGLVPKEIQPEQIYQYLQFRHATKPQTFYRHIHELKEGTVLFWERDKTTLYSYLLPQHPNLRRGKPDQLIHHTERLLTESLQRHLLADVPVGLFLSGGIDSSLLLALLHRSGHKHFPAFAVVHKARDKSFGTEDGRFARLAAQKFEAELTCLEIDDTLLQETDAWVQSLDQPIADGAGLLTAHLSRAVKPHIKVALSGAGADELFAGYNRHRAFYQYLRHRDLARVFQVLAWPLAPLLPTGFSHPLRKQFVLLRKLAYKITPDPRQTFINFTSLDRHLAQLHVNPDPAEKPGTGNTKSQEEWLRWALRRDQHQYLISDILAITDQAGMQHSLEIRTPYLENHLQLYLSLLPSQQLFKGGQKWVLKEILAGCGGADLVNRSKEGFGMPLGNWLRQSRNHYLLQELQDPDSLIFEYIHFGDTQKLLQVHLKQRHDFSSEIWALIVLAKWLQHNFA